MKRSKPPVMAIIKIWVGMGLFWFSGGALLIILGLLPAALVLAGVGILSLGVVSAGTMSVMTGLGIIWAAIGIPIALRGIAWFEEGLQELTGWNIGLTDLAQRGTNKIPIVGTVVEMSTS